MLVSFDSSEYVTAESLRAESRVRNNERSITGAAYLYRDEAKSQLSYRLTNYRATFISASVSKANERYFAEYLETAWQFVK
jgi:hypothetical protein